MATLLTDDGLALGAREVTLTWTDAAGVKHSAQSLTDGLGVAAFWVAVPAGGTEYFATSGGLQSNGVYLTGTTLVP